MSQRPVGFDPRRGPAMLPPMRSSQPAVARVRINPPRATVADIWGYRVPIPLWPAVSRWLFQSAVMRGNRGALFIRLSTKPIFNHLPMRFQHFAKRLRCLIISPYRRIRKTLYPLIPFRGLK